MGSAGGDLLAGLHDADNLGVHALDRDLERLEHARGELNRHSERRSADAGC